MRHLVKTLTLYLKSAATPFCLETIKLIESEQWGILATRKVLPSSYHNAESYLIDAQANAFFSKNASLDSPDLNPERAAKQAWIEAEGRCAITNAFISRLQHGPMDQDDMRTREFLLRVRRRMKQWLGPLPSELNSRFGPGVTMCCRGKLSTVADKMTVSPTTTLGASRYAEFALGESAWFRSLFERGVLSYSEGSLSGLTLVRESLWASVPKNAKTHRSIEIGPSLNVSLQLDIGKTMKRRFRQRGWDLQHAADSHKRVAREASISGDYATIDLKQASDSVSRNLVKFLLPDLWYELLDDLRSKSIKIDGRTQYLEKFSGMGNGYTFELESVIFMAIAQEVLSTLNLNHVPMIDVFVFGDDIIVPTAASKLLVLVLSRLGFDTNVDKTFVEGPFRESCGGDFYKGTAVRPFYLKEFPNEPQQWIIFANGIRRVGLDESRSGWFRDLFLKLWFRIQDALPTAVRTCRGPVDFGDIVIHDEQSTWTTKTRNCIRLVRTYSPVVKRVGSRRGGAIIEWDYFHSSVQLATVLLNQGEREGIVPRNPRLSYLYRWVPFS